MQLFEDGNYMHKPIHANEDKFIRYDTSFKAKKLFVTNRLHTARFFLRCNPLHRCSNIRIEVFELCPIDSATEPIDMFYGIL